jgi:outer membrane cobalamin receptor
MKRKGVYLGCAMLWMWLGVCLPAAAEETKKETTKEYFLGEVVVSADRPGKEVIKTVEITAADIEKRNALTLAKALELLPGVDIRRGGRRRSQGQHPGIQKQAYHFAAQRHSCQLHL